LRRPRPLGADDLRHPVRRPRPRAHRRRPRGRLRPEPLPRARARPRRRGLAMIRRALLASTLALAACNAEAYDNNDAELAVRQKAKEMCSCLFVMELSEQECAAWTRVSPNVARATIDRENKRV